MADRRLDLRDVEAGLAESAEQGLTGRLGAAVVGQRERRPRSRRAQRRQADGTDPPETTWLEPVTDQQYTGARTNIR